MSRQRLFTIAMVSAGVLLLLNPDTGSAQTITTLNEGERGFGNGIGTYGQNPAFSGSYYYGSPRYAYRAYYPAPTPVGWQQRSDGWMYYWAQGQVVGAYHSDSESWYPYSGSGWGQAATPPWKK